MFIGAGCYQQPPPGVRRIVQTHDAARSPTDRFGIRETAEPERELDFALVLILGLVAGTIGGIVGFGTSIMLMPALVLVFGPRQAVPIMAIASIMANASRVAAWWREVDWRTTLA